MAFAKVQPTGSFWAVGGSASNVLTISASLAGAPTVGNLVVVGIAWGNSNVTGVSVKDGNSNTYTAATSSPFVANSQTVGIWYWVATGTPTATITATWTGSTTVDIWVAEFSGNAAAGSVFDSSATTGNAAETNVILPSFTPAGAGELFVSALGTNGATSSANSPWTGMASSVPASGNFGEYYIKPTTGAQAVAYTTSSASNACIIAAFKAAAAGGSPFVPKVVDLPPGGLRGTADRITFAYPALKGAAGQAPFKQTDQPNPVLRIDYKQSPDLVDWTRPSLASQGAAGQSPFHPPGDTPIPRAAGNWPKDWVWPFLNAQPFAQYDWLNPYPPRRVVDLTWQPPGLKGAAGQPPFNQDDFQNPFSPRRTIDLSTWIEPALQGAAGQAPFNQDDHPLPPLRVVQRFDWSLPAIQTTVVIQPPFAQYDWPLPGRVGSRQDWQQAALQGAAGQAPFNQEDYQNPTLPRRIDPTWAWPAIQTTVVAPSPFFQTDFQNPGQSRRAIDLTWTWPAIQVVAVVSPPFISVDYPNPAGPRRAVDLSTWTVSGLQGAAGQAPFFQTDYQNPFAARRGVDLSVWTISALQGAAGQSPFNQTDYQNPFAARPGVDLSTWTLSALQGAAGQASFAQFDWPNPQTARRGLQDWTLAALQGAAGQPPFQPLDIAVPRGSAPRLQDWTLPAIQVVVVIPAPFAQFDWPNPLPTRSTIDLSTWTNPALQGAAGQSPFSQTDYQNPFASRPGIDLTTWAQWTFYGIGVAPSPPPPTEPEFDLGVRHTRRYTVSEWAQLQGWLKARRDKRKEEAAKAAAVKAIEARTAEPVSSVEVPENLVKDRGPPQRPISAKARRKLKEALAPPPALTTVQLSAVSVTTVQPSFAELRAQLRAEWEAVLAAAHEDAIEQEDEEAVIHLLMHIMGEE